MDYLPFEQSGHKCLVCGADNLLSLTAIPTPVRDKLKQIIEHKRFSTSDVMILCTPCFNMVERFDVLETELDQIRTELISKYVQTLGPQYEQRTQVESKPKRKETSEQEQDSLSWQQQQVPVDLLQPEVNLTADSEGSDETEIKEESDSDDDSSAKSNNKKVRKSRKRKETQPQETDKAKKPYTGKPRGRPRKDAPKPRSPSPPKQEPPPDIMDNKDKPVFEYDHDYPFFKEGERLRSGQIIINPGLQTTFVDCIYCNESRTDVRAMNAHVWNIHKPHIVTTHVPTEIEGQTEECNFGVQLSKVAPDSQALGRHFMCIFCDGTFKFKSNLLQHYRENHSPHKPFTCVECNEKFRRSIEVSRHKVYYCPNKKPIPGGRNENNMSVPTTD